MRECLKPGGKAGLQIITIKPDAYQAYRANPDFIQRYVFPGGMLPTENHSQVAGRGQPVWNSSATAPSVRTTAARWPSGASGSGTSGTDIQPMGFDLRFKRLWEFYMYYCEAGFRSGHINVRQVVYN